MLRERLSVVWKSETHELKSRQVNAIVFRQCAAPCSIASRDYSGTAVEFAHGRFPSSGTAAGGFASESMPLVVITGADERVVCLEGEVVRIVVSSAAAGARGGCGTMLHRARTECHSAAQQLSYITVAVPRRKPHGWRDRPAVAVLCVGHEQQHSLLGPHSPQSWPTVPRSRSRWLLCSGIRSVCLLLVCKHQPFRSVGRHLPVLAAPCAGKCLVRRHVV